MTQIDSLLFGLKREFWEHRRAILWAPIGFSILILLVSIMLNVAFDPAAKPSSEIGVLEQESGQFFENEETKQQSVKDESRKRNPSRKSLFYLSLAWLVSIFYLLSALYSDRKDNSIIFWKSLPVSETQNAIHKLTFAVLCFPVVALAISWVLNILQIILQLKEMQSAVGGDTWLVVERSFDAQHMIVIPLIGVVAGTLWGLPLFCYALMVSAMAKKYPLLFFIVPLVALAFVERMTYQGSYVFDFVVNHSPFSALSALSDAPNLKYFFQSQFADKLPDLVLGCGLAFIFFLVAIWHRNHRFEI